MGISWRDHIANDEVLQRVDLGNLSEIVRQRRLRFAGHILRLPENRSHARTVVRECCKGDDESQWERGKFDPRHPKTP